jgi:hypothetical protein
MLPVCHIGNLFARVRFLLVVALNAPDSCLRHLLDIYIGTEDCIQYSLSCKWVLGAEDAEIEELREVGAI